MAWWLTYLTVGWNLVEAGAALVSGSVTRSVSLVAFGLDSLVETSSALIIAWRLTRAGQPPKVLTAGAVVGTGRAAELFEAAYDEHARRLAKLYARIGLAEEV